jgi:hypothetical protein
MADGNNSVCTRQHRENTNISGGLQTPIPINVEKILVVKNENNLS